MPLTNEKMTYFTKKTFRFLEDIKLNNNRDWFVENKPRYEAARKELKKFADDLMDRLALFDESLRDAETPYIFRIYRDARYSKGIPYKTNLAVFFLKGGRPAMCERAGYYLHLQPDNSFFGGGAYRPTAKWLSAIRDEIVSNPKKLKKIIHHPDFEKYYCLVDAKLKTAPRGFAKDHPEIELLRYKSFAGFHPLSDAQVLGEDFLEDLAQAFRALYPLNNWLNQIALRV